MNLRKLNEELTKLLETNPNEDYGNGNTNEARLKLIKPGVYINRGQSEVTHAHFPDQWQYFGPYLQPTRVQKYHSWYGDDNETPGNGEIKEFAVKVVFSDEFVTVVGELVKTWEEFEEEDDNIHHWYHEEYKILEVK